MDKTTKITAAIVLCIVLLSLFLVDVFGLSLAEDTRSIFKEIIAILLAGLGGILGFAVGRRAA